MRAISGHCAMAITKVMTEWTTEQRDHEQQHHQQRK